MVSTLAQLAHGQKVPELTRELTRLDLVRYCGASGDYTPVHWDQCHMEERGYPDVIAHGWFTFGLMSETLACWIPEDVAIVRRYTVRYFSPVYPGSIIMGGNVEEQFDAIRHPHARLALWARSADGRTCSTGTVVLSPVTVREAYPGEEIV